MPHHFKVWGHVRQSQDTLMLFPHHSDQGVREAAENFNGTPYISSSNAGREDHR
jgi:hypothetical protein